VVIIGRVPFFCYGDDMKKIIDVSEHQANIDWKALKPNIDGVIIRCGYGDDDVEQDDKFWERNVSECERLKIPYGVYLYSYADSDAHIKSEIAHVKRLLKGHKPQLPVYIDLEESAFGRWAVKCADRFCTAIKKAGFTPGVYTFESFYNSFMNGWSNATLWIAKFGANDGEPHDKPNVNAKYDAWQYTSNGYIKGYGNRLDVSLFYRNFTIDNTNAKQAAGTSTSINRGQVAADIHKRMVNDNRFGYSWEERWGAKPEKWTVGGVSFDMPVGDYDCSSSCTQAWRKALTGTKYAKALDAATYTGNMREVFVKSGLFAWKPISFIASPGDLYLNEQNHVAMCQGQSPDLLSEFSWGDKGAYGNRRGDQSGREAAVNAYYDYPWDGILHYNGKAGGGTAPAPKPAAITFRLSTDSSGKKWLAANNKGTRGKAIRWLAIKGVKRYRVHTAISGWLPWVYGYNIKDLDKGCAGDGTPINGVQVDDSNARYAVRVLNRSWYADMTGFKDTGGSNDNFAGDLANNIDGFRITKS